MARKPNNVSKTDVSRLIQEIENEIGFKILYPIDCEGLSDTVFRKTKHYLSPVTLKRFMGFYKSGFNPSYQTLDVLSFFCGYVGWNDFIYPTAKKNISQNELDFFMSFFNQKDYTRFADHDESMQLISRRIAERLREDPRAFEKIIPELAKSTLGQTFYFEHFPDYDNLVSYQYKGYIEYLKHKTNTEAQVFGNCLLFFRAFLLMDKPLMKQYYDTLAQLEIPENIHPMPLGRYYKCLLLYTHFVEEKSLDKIIKHIFSIEKRLPQFGLHFKNFPGFHYFVSDALTLCGYYKEVLKLIDLATKNYKIDREFIWKGYYRQFQLMQAEAYYGLNNKEKSVVLMKKVNPNNFYFISRKYFSLRYLLLKSRLQNLTITEKNSVSEIIRTCGYTCFS